MKDTQSKLLVITRRDISPGYQAVQSAHAAIEFQHEHPEIATKWNTESKYLVFLSVPDEQSLIKLLKKAQMRGLTYSIFKEPDIDNQVTAIALEPTERARKLCSHLPLALN